MASIPQARVVRSAGVLIAPPPPPRAPRPPRPPFKEQVQTALGVAVGLWPLTAVVLLVVGLLYMGTMMNAP
jgi:hypothetical protein